MLEPHLVQVAAGIIAKADASHPADAVLRETFKSVGHISRLESRAVSEAVFSYFRWYGWFKGLPVENAVPQALALDKKYSMNPESFSDEELRVKTVPAWAYAAIDVSVDWFRALQREPSLWLRAKTGTGERVARRLGHCDFVHGNLPDTLRYDGREDLFRTPGFQAGEFELQDISSQVVGFVSAPKPGETWWDACAGEGGKTLHLSDLMQNKGLIWASDRSEWRLRKLKQRTGRAGVFNYRSVLWDGGKKLPTKTKFDGVLVDAPCSGTGTWQRNPHARWTTTEIDVRELAEVQNKLLAHVAESIKPGGKLVYSVCTLTKGETSEVADTFSKAFPQFQPLLVSNPLNFNDPPKHHLWLWPQAVDGNGMFICSWTKQV